VKKLKTKFIADTRMGITELRNKTTEYLKLVEEIEIAIPYQDNELNKKLLEMSLNLTELLEILKNYQ
jgi:hypothetical protein